MSRETVPKWVKSWFYGAAVYNVIWGAWVILFPGMFFDLVGMVRVNYLPIWQGVGMMVAVFGLGYYYIARDHERYANYVWIGIIGKTLGPVGGVYGVLTGQLPPAFLWVFLFNDVVWWPAFWRFAFLYARKPFKA